MELQKFISTSLFLQFPAHVYHQEGSNNRKLEIIECYVQSFFKILLKLYQLLQQPF